MKFKTIYEQKALSRDRFKFDIDPSDLYKAIVNVW